MATHFDQDFYFGDVHPLRDREGEPFVVGQLDVRRFVVSCGMRDFLDRLPSFGLDARGSGPHLLIAAPYYGTGTPEGTTLARAYVSGNSIEVDTSICPEDDHKYYKHGSIAFFWRAFSMVLAEAGASAA